MSNQTFSLDNSSGPYFLSRSLYPKDLVIGAVSLVGTFILFGVAQSREPRLARLKCQYPSLVSVAVLGLAVLIIHALGSVLVFLWGVSKLLADRYIYLFVWPQLFKEWISCYPMEQFFFQLTHLARLLQTHTLDYSYTLALFTNRRAMQRFSHALSNELWLIQWVKLSAL